MPVEIIHNGRTVSRSKNLRGVLAYCRTSPPASIVLEPAADGGGVLHVSYADGATCSAGFASLTVLRGWIKRPTFRGVLTLEHGPTPLPAGMKQPVSVAYLYPNGASVSGRLWRLPGCVAAMNAAGAFIALPEHARAVPFNGDRFIDATGCDAMTWPGAVEFVTGLERPDVDDFTAALAAQRNLDEAAE